MSFIVTTFLNFSFKISCYENMDSLHRDKMRYKQSAYRWVTVNAINVPLLSFLKVRLDRLVLYLLIPKWSACQHAARKICKWSTWHCYSMLSKLRLPWSHRSVFMTSSISPCLISFKYWRVPLTYSQPCLASVYQSYFYKLVHMEIVSLP